MSRDGRPDPDNLLKVVSAQEKASRKGRLRVFFGMSAGVGKTYAMLKAAHRRQEEGVRVVVALVETHGRHETAELLRGLTILPRKKIEYRGTKLEEMDLDAILRDRPELVLVDELAHSNVPGSRHPKRYQDVLEILDEGIDVYTTINVQHLESRKDSVEAITRVPIRETVPDSILEQAHLVELVDIGPSELLKRLRDGKVYLGDKAERAATNFFREESLTALREIALRLTAERVDQDLQKFGDARRSVSPWQTNERLMVAVSHSPSSETLIRATRRLAYNLEAPWIAVHVDSGETLSNEDQAQLSRNIQFARELKADVITTVDRHVAVALHRVAMQKNVTQIVIGRSPPSPWPSFFRFGFLNRVTEECADVDIHVLRQDSRARAKSTWWRRIKFETGFSAYWSALWFIAGLALIGGLAEPSIGYQSVGFIFLLGVLFAGLVGSLGPVVFCAVSSALIWNFFFIPPRMTFAISEAEDFFMILTFLVVAIITGYLAHRARSQERILREREDRANILYEVSQDIAQSRDKTEFLSKITDRLGLLLGGECGVIIRSQEGELQINETKRYGLPLNEKEKAVATWAFESGKPAGWSTDTLMEARGLYLPLQTAGACVGVLVYQPKSKRKLSLEQENLIHAVARQVASSLEKHFFEKRLRQSQRFEESEKLHQTLLNSISHEMKTPLTIIMGSSQMLDRAAVESDPEAVRRIAKDLSQSSQRLNRVVENLLDMSRLNSGVMALKKSWHDISDLVGVTIAKDRDFLSDHELIVDVQDDLPLVKIDPRLIEHAISNILVNAALYSPPKSVIRLEVRGEGPEIQIAVDDEGRGIPDESLPLIFNKFYRVPGSPPGGTGLGLSIVKEMMEAHDGEVRIVRGLRGGTRATLILPVPEKQPPLPEET